MDQGSVRRGAGGAPSGPAQLPGASRGCHRCGEYRAAREPARRPGPHPRPSHWQEPHQEGQVSSCKSSIKNV